MSVIVSVVDCESQPFFQQNSQKHYEKSFPNSSNRQTRNNTSKHKRSVLREIRPSPYLSSKPVAASSAVVRQVENQQRIPVCDLDDDDVRIIMDSQNIPSMSQNLRVPESSKEKSRTKSPKKTRKEPELTLPISTGFEAGYEAEAIVGAKDGQQGIFYLVKWKERDEMELVPALTTLTYVPSLVILFYAKRLQWIVSSLSAPG